MVHTAHLSPACQLVNILSGSDGTLLTYPPVHRVNPHTPRAGAIGLVMNRAAIVSSR